MRTIHMRRGVLAAAACAVCCAIAAPVSGATPGVLTLSQVRALFAAHGITLGSSTFAVAKTRFAFPASLTKNVVVLVPTTGHSQGLSDLVVLVWTKPSKAQQASSAWVHQLTDRGSWYAVDYNVVWSSTKQSEVASPILHAITNKIIVEECEAGGQSAAACGKLVA